MVVAHQIDNVYFKAVFNQKSVGLVIVDPQGQFVRANNRFCDIMGYTQDELLKMNVSDIAYHGEPLPDHECLELLLSGAMESTEIEKRYVRKNRSLVWTKVTGSLIYPYENKPLGLFLVQDITSRKQVEKEKEQSQARFESIYHSNLIGILFWNTDGYILDANDALLNMLGYSRTELKSGQLKWTDITPPEYASVDKAAYERMMQGERMVPYEKQYIHKDGHRLDILIRSGMVDNSATVGMACILDITQQKKAETERELYATKLAQSNQDLELFATIISHDLQAPLRKIKIFSEAIQSVASQDLSAEGHDYLERINRSAIKMQELINAVLDISRVHRKGRPFEPVSLESVAREAADNMIYLIQKTEGIVELNQLDITLDADPIQLRQLLQNLIENGLKFHRPDVKPLVKVSASLEGPNSCKISVEDNGIGFEKKFRDRIFQIFERLNSPQSYEGMGVGLALCKKVVERHNGTITADSVPGQGSVFTVVLPIRQ